jgi:hypothetical protein
LKEAMVILTRLAEVLLEDAIGNWTIAIQIPPAPPADLMTNRISTTLAAMMTSYYSQMMMMMVMMMMRVAMTNLRLVSDLPKLEMSVSKSSTLAVLASSSITVLKLRRYHHGRPHQHLSHRDEVGAGGHYRGVRPRNSLSGVPTRGQVRQIFPELKVGHTMVKMWEVMLEWTSAISPQSTTTETKTDMDVDKN